MAEISFEQEVALMQLDAEEHERWRQKQLRPKAKLPVYSNTCDTLIRSMNGQSVSFLFGASRVVFSPESPEHSVPKWFAKNLIKHDPKRWKIVGAGEPENEEPNLEAERIRAHYTESAIEELIAGEDVIDSVAVELREAAMRVRNNPTPKHVEIVEQIISKIGTGEYRKIVVEEESENYSAEYTESDAQPAAPGDQVQIEEPPKRGKKDPDAVPRRKRT